MSSTITAKNGRNGSPADTGAGPLTLPASLRASGRQSAPDYYSPYTGGLAVVPRVGWDETTCGYWDGLRGEGKVTGTGVHALRSWAEEAPLRLLGVLIDAHPMAQMAISNDLALAFSPGDTRIVAAATQTDRETSPEGTALIEDLWRRCLPREIGGMTGLQRILGKQVTKYGAACVEAVPARQVGGGVAEVLDFSPLSIRYRDTADQGRILEQRQQGTPSGWKELSPLTCLAYPWDGSRENPYGTPRYRAFLSEGLADFGEQGRLNDVMKAIAWPHLAFEFPVEQTVKFALENPEALRGMGADGGDLTGLGYAETTFLTFVELMKRLLADDSIFMPLGTKANVLNAGQGLESMSSAFERRRIRICQSLDHLPNLLGITDGGTLAYASVQWRHYAGKIEALRGFVNHILVAVANLHLRLLGLPLVARAEVTPLQSSDRMADAQADWQEMKTRREKWLAGLISDEDFGYLSTEAAPTDPARMAAYYERLMSGPAATATLQPAPASD
jgi:hypothetical protein